jgi:glycine cleavage system regulatory protein
MSKTNDKSVAADVYAGDTTAPSPTGPATAVFLFRIVADAEPDVLVRIAGIFNIANIAPRRATLRRTSPDQVNISIAIELSLAANAEMIRRKLEQLTCTLSAEWVALNPVLTLPP